MVADYPIFKNVNLHTIQFKTGDIVSVSYNHRFGGFISAWTGSAISHPGIIYKRSKDGKLFVIEASLYEKPWKGIFKIPFYKWLECNKGHEIFYTRYNGKEITDEEILNSYENIKNKRLEAFNVTWYRLLKKEPYRI